MAKLKSILRKELIAEFIEINQLTLKETTLANQFVEIYNILAVDASKSHYLLNDFMQKINTTQIKEIDTTQLVSELYKLKNFDWGGDYQNALDKYLVNRYVKIFKSYEILVSKFETEIQVERKKIIII